SESRASGAMAISLCGSLAAVSAPVGDVCACTDLPENATANRDTSAKHIKSFAILPRLSAKGGFMALTAVLVDGDLLSLPHLRSSCVQHIGVGSLSTWRAKAMSERTTPPHRRFHIPDSKSMA
ncbi:hypothetical protein, partial [Roseovarius sp.]|uniref:hypothetical protein n=1 Tax=Roseovarius sp. TaxID=1486281 RepID=UPI003565802D